MCGNYNHCHVDSGDPGATIEKHCNQFDLQHTLLEEAKILSVEVFVCFLDYKFKHVQHKKKAQEFQSLVKSILWQKRIRI